jgi:hypothetical protein
MNDKTPYPAPRKCFRWTPIGYVTYLKGIRKATTLFRAGPHLDRLAVRAWQIAPGNSTVTSKAYFLDGQLERVTGMVYTDNPRRDMIGGIEFQHAPTRALLLRDVFLLDGSLYKHNCRLDLYSRQRMSKGKYYFPTTGVRMEIDRASIYSSYDGNEYFGLWLTDDCTTYPLAQAEGVPVTSNQPASAHTLQYEGLLGMTPVRADAAYLKEAVFFDDNWNNNTSKRDRFAAVKQKLQAAFAGAAHPGVFILRRDSGKSRIMLNELEMAEHLRKSRGFRVVDVTTHSVPQILAACAGAQVVAGIEGSQLMHGLMVLPRGASMLTMQPPQRFSPTFKVTTDMMDQNYSFVVGRPAQEGFTVDPDEVERTLDLLPLTAG